MMPAYAEPARHAGHPLHQHVYGQHQRPIRAAGTVDGAQGGHPTAALDYPVRFPVHSVPADLTVPSDQAHLVPRARDVAAKKYATSVDDRNFLTVYEYLVNGQWVIWDYYTGFVHLTGLWKAIGHSKVSLALKLFYRGSCLEIPVPLHSLLRRFSFPGKVLLVAIAHDDPTQNARPVSLLLLSAGINGWAIPNLLPYVCCWIKGGDPLSMFLHGSWRSHANPALFSC